MKKIFLFLFSFFLLFSLNAFAEEKVPMPAERDSGTLSVPIEVFERETCAHCKAEKEFFMELKLKRDDFSVRFHDIDEEAHYNHWLQLTDLERIPKVTPITLVGNVIIQGFDTKDTTGRRITDLIDKSIGKHTYNFEEFIKAGGTKNVETVEGGVCDEKCEIEGASPLFVKIPFFGVTNVKKFSLPFISIILGFIDGFNPCAMWVLVTFLVFLAQAGNRRRMFAVAGLFILAETIMYYLILNVWFTAWDFVGLNRIVIPLVGLVSIGAGSFFLYQWKTSDGTCKVGSLEQKKKTGEKIKLIVNAPLTIFTALGIIMLALSVNIIEFACSIGIPQAFTKILELNSLSFFFRQLYMFLYILFYMIDDFIVFGIALYAFDKIGVTTKYARWSHLIGGILMLIIGLLLIFKPSYLIF